MHASGGRSTHNEIFPERSVSTKNVNTVQKQPLTAQKIQAAAAAAAPAGRGSRGIPVLQGNLRTNYLFALKFLHWTSQLDVCERIFEYFEYFFDLQEVSVDFLASKLYKPYSCDGW